MNSAPASQLISSIHLLNGRLFNELFKKEKDIHFTSEQGKILHCLYRHNPMTLTELSDQSSLAKNTLTSMLKRLEKEGFVSHSDDKTDKRKKLYSLTPYGNDQQALAMKLSNTLSDIFYRGFSPDEVHTLEDYLCRIKQNLKDE